MARTLPTAALLAIVSAGLLAQPARDDLVVLNGAIVDGTGNPWCRADLGIRDGHIVAIGSVERSAAVNALQSRAS